MVGLDGGDSKTRAQIPFERENADLVRMVGHGWGRRMVMLLNLVWVDYDAWRKLGRKDPEGLSFGFIET